MRSHTAYYKAEQNNEIAEILGRRLVKSIDSALSHKAFCDMINSKSILPLNQLTGDKKEKTKQQKETKLDQANLFLTLLRYGESNPELRGENAIC